ncbi:MAG: helix-turn-helix domain-containing protein, partial [Janthinobacterium sp.]
AHVTLRTDTDVRQAVRPDRPAMPAAPVVEHVAAYTSLSRMEKLAALRAGMAAHGVAPVLPLDVYLRQAERDMIVRALVQARYHRARAARQLGLSVRQLRYRMQKLTIQEPLP